MQAGADQKQAIFLYETAQCGEYQDMEYPKRDTLLYGNERGTTMAEVLIGFAFLMILMAALVHVIDISSDLLMMAKDTVSEQEQFQEQLYRKVPDADQVDVKLLEDAALIFYEIEADGAGEEFSRTGVSLKLEHAEVKAWKYHALNAAVYQVLYHEGEQEE